MAVAQTKVLSRNVTILEDDFLLFPHQNTRFKVKLSRAGISYEPINDRKSKGGVKYINRGDITGCHCLKGKNDADNGAYLTIYYYPFRKKLLSSKLLRHRSSLTFNIQTSDQFIENLSIANKWQVVIRSLAAKGIFDENGNGLNNCILADTLTIFNTHRS